jgi:hypothetical protein
MIVVTEWQVTVDVIRYVKGRIIFQGATHPASFPSSIAILS